MMHSSRKPDPGNSKMDPSRYDQKLEHILRTSARIFAEKSYHSTSMRDISRATGMSLAGLYHYCKSKDELLFLIQEQQPAAGKVDLNVATYALFGMMNWIYNWYDPSGKLKVSQLVDQIAHLF